ncbi:hypothetical protein WJX73_004749 [Symbiochloris irregularis]|uniref:Glycosyl transferase CAP10 domain-containing protein n=1 Tax=Symbiochloris irregularis TaxID=706552 RepID=A0AAW1P2F4_9CHLO
MSIEWKSMNRVFSSDFAAPKLVTRTLTILVGAFLAVALLDHTLWQGSLRAGLTTGRPILAGRHRDAEAYPEDQGFQEAFDQIGEDLRPYRQTGITLEMVESSYCSCTHNGWRLQVVNGSMVRGPHLQQAKKLENEHLILHPGPSFGGWPEVKFSKWVEMQQTMGLAAQQYPWEERDPALFFAGCNLGPQRNVLFDNQEMIRRDHPEASINWICWERPELVPPVFDFCKHKHLLNIMGNSWSSRLKYLFLCGSTVVFPESPYIEFWYKLLKHGHNVVRTPEITRENRGEPLLEAARALIANETNAKRLAANAWHTGSMWMDEH